METINIQDFDTDKYLNKYLNPKHQGKEAYIQKVTTRHNESVQRIKSDDNLSETQKNQYLKDLKKRFDARVDDINNTKYWVPPTQEQKDMMLRFIEIEAESQQTFLSSSLELSPLPAQTILENRLCVMLAQEAKERFSSIHADVIAGRVVQRFQLVARYIGFIRFAQKISRELQQMGDTALENPKPLKWIAKTAHLGHIMNLFAELGYIDAPKKRNGEINYSEFARSIGKAFDFEGSNIGTLTKMLSPETNNIEIHNIEKISIPHVKDIS